MFVTIVRRLALCAVAPALLGLASPAQAAPRAPVPEDELVNMIVLQTNLRRERLGCGWLRYEPELALASIRQSGYMAETGNFSHIGRGGSTFVSRSQAAGYAQPSGENIGWGYWNATEVMDAWMQSPGHRANILNCDAKSIGVSVVYSADGTPYYTQLFGWV